MTRREWLLLTAAAASVGFRGQDADNIGAARDLVYQALERLSASATPADVSAAARLLKNSLDQDGNFGDAHYYRALCLERLNQDSAMQRLHRESAERYQSEALRDKRNPFVLAVPKIYESLPTVGQKWALVVGISRFQPKVGPKTLDFAANDATAFAKVLADPAVGRFPADHVVLLTNQQATTAAIKSQLNRIARQARPEDIVVTYISTHGSPRSDDLRQVSYLFTYDTDTSHSDLMFGTALPMVEVSSIISTRCAAQRTVVIFDTCHSGAGSESASLSPGDMDRLREGAGRYVLSSCEPDQKSYESDGHGLFTSSLIGALSARNGCIRLKDLFTHVQQEVSVKAQKVANARQRPVMAHSDSAAEILLGAPIGGASDACAGKA